MPIVADAQVAIRGDLDGFRKDVASARTQTVTLGADIRKALSFGPLAAQGPDALVAGLHRARDEADGVTASIRKLAESGKLPAADARKYADLLDEIGIEADQTASELKQLRAADPAFNTPGIQAAGREIDRVGDEAKETAAQLNAMKGVRADTHLERLAQEARESSKALDATGKSSGGLLSKLNSVKGALIGLGLFIGAQQVVSGLKNFLGGSIDAATELQTATTGVRTVLGEASSEVIAFGETSADSFGLSKRAAAEYGAVLGAQLKAADFDLAAAARETVNLEQKAADLASTFGGEVGDAVTAISALLRGERDTIEKYGVSIKQVDVNARIASLGLDTSTAAALKNATAVASLSLLYEQTADATGQFARNSELNAGVQARSSAKIENAMAKLGDTLLPLMADITEFSAEVLPGLIDGILTLGKTVTDVGQAWATVGINFGAMGDRLHEIADDTDRTFDEVKNRIAYYMREMGLSFTDAADRAEREFERTSDSYKLTVKDIGGTPGPARLRSIEEIAALMAQGAEAGADAAADEAGGMPQKMADAMLAAQQDLDDPIAQLLRYIEESLSPAQIIARDQGFLQSVELANGLASNNPFVRQKAIEMRDAALAEIKKMGGVGAAGYAIGATWTQRIAAGIDDNSWRIVSQLNYIRPILEGFSPPKKGPFKDIDKWGFNIGQAFTGGLAEGIGPLNLPSLGSWASTAQSLLPSFAATAVPSVATPLGVTAGGDTYNLNVTGRVSVDDARDAIEELRRLAGIKV